MADPRYSHPDFGTREEDWPDIDMDSDTEEGRESIQRAEAALVATVNRTIAQNNEQLVYPGIPEALYKKALNHQDQLTDEERRLLLSRGDLVGKVLAAPDSLTIDEIYKTMQWPPPSVVCANIQRATGGTLSTPEQLYAKAKDAIDAGQLGAMLSEDAIYLLTDHFYARDSTTFDPGAMWTALRVPGTSEAIALLTTRLGLDIAVSQACGIYTSDKFIKERLAPRDQEPAHEISRGIAFLSTQYERGHVSFQEAGAFSQTNLKAYKIALDSLSRVRKPVPDALLKQTTISMKSLREEHSLGNITDQEAIVRTREYLTSIVAAYSPPAPAPPTVPSADIPDADATALSQSDRYASAPWPAHFAPQPPIKIFQSATKLPGANVVFAWLDLSENQREAYRAEYETVRRAAWAAQETDQARRARDLPPPPMAENGPDLRYPHNLAVPGSLRERMPGLLEGFPILTGLWVYADEIGRDGDFQERIARWEALTDEQQAVYTARAELLNAAAEAATSASRKKFYSTNPL